MEEQYGFIIGREHAEKIDILIDAFTNLWPNGTITAETALVVRVSNPHLAELIGELAGTQRIYAPKPAEAKGPVFLITAQGLPDSVTVCPKCGKHKRAARKAWCRYCLAAAAKKEKKAEPEPVQTVGTGPNWDLPEEAEEGGGRAGSLLHWLPADGKEAAQGRIVSGMHCKGGFERRLSAGRNTRASGHGCAAGAEPADAGAA